MMNEVTAEAVKRELCGSVPDEMLFNYMNGLYLDACGKRTFWDNPTVEGWALERERLKRVFSEMFSPFPKSAPLNPRTAATRKRDGYRLDCVLFDSAPDVTVTANLYVPDGAENAILPAVVLACGHANEGKSYYRATAEALVKAGMVVLCFDPTGQGERFETWNYLRWTQRAHGEHDRLGALSILIGDNISGIFAWDCMRAIDYVLSLDYVDKERLGFMGASGGGTQTTWAAALDERISVCVPCCFITSIEKLLTAREPADSEQNPPGLLRNGLEYRDFLAMMAPKPVLVLAAEDDFFPVSGAVDTVKSLKTLYKCFGCEDRAEICRFPGGHAGRGAMSTFGLNWLCRWFGLPQLEFATGTAAKIDEEEAKKSAVDSDTFAVGGRLLNSRSTRNYWTYYRELIRNLEEAPLDRARLRSVLAVGQRDARPLITQKRVFGMTGGTLEYADGITIPFLYAVSGNADSERLCVLSHEDGMACLFDEGREARLLLAEGFDVLAFDPRGVGATRGGTYGWWPYMAKTFLKPMSEGALPYYALGYVDPEYEGTYSTGFELAMHGIKLDLPLIGQRVRDSLRVLDSIQRISGRDYGNVHIYGSGYAAAQMLYADLLTDVYIKSSVYYAPIASYKLLAEAPEHRYSLEHLARGLLRAGDIPASVKALTHQTAVIDPVDALRFPLDRELAERYLKNTNALRIYTDLTVNPLYAAVSALKGQ